MKPENFDPTLKLDSDGEVIMKEKSKPIIMWLLSKK
jgi:hypothetical protein